MQIPEGFEIVDVPLHAVRHKEHGVIKTFPDGRVIEFFEAEEDQYVMAYSESGVVEWKPVRGFSVHDGCEVVIVNLTNGLQIISDHDPRAVAGLEPGKSETGALQRFYPAEALAKSVVVPCVPVEGLIPWGDETYTETFTTVWEAMANKSTLFQDNRLTRLSFDKIAGRWVVRNHEYKERSPLENQCYKPHLHWAGIESLEYTGKIETSYDLTVPGFETFMSAEGVILSNTMNISLPSLPESVQEAKDVLMPSRMLMSIKSPDTIVPALKHEQILGLYTSKNSPAQNKHKFATEDEALEGLRKGTVKYSDDIEIGD